MKLADVIASTGRHFGVEPCRLMGRVRSKRIAEVRGVAMFLCHERGWSDSEIGDFMNGRDSSSVWFGRSITRRRLRERSDFAREVESLKRKLAGEAA